MTQRFYLVTAKCGHVGRNNYTIVTFPVKATSGREAAHLIRYAPRVKHDQKDAILRVVEVCMEEYYRFKKEYRNDPYFECTSIQEQKRKCESISIYKEDKEDDDELERRDIHRKNRIAFMMKKRKSILYEI